jgi:Kef-type K+ transport system membrane component KefB
VQLIEIAIFVPLILFGLSRLGGYLLSKVEDDEDAYFILMLVILAVAGTLATSINLPGIVGAFLAGLAINAAAQNRPAKEKLEFFGNSFFIPIFFLATGFLIDPLAFYQSITTNFPLAAGVIGALLLGKWIAAEIVGRAFAYSSAIFCSPSMPSASASFRRIRWPLGSGADGSRCWSAGLLSAMSPSAS